MSLTIVSGGQTGVDRAALDVAISLGLRYWGWCPRHGWAEDYPEPPGLLIDYPQLWPTPQADPRQRSIWNAQDSDATLALTLGNIPDGGTKVAVDRAAELGRRYLVISLYNTGIEEEVLAFLDSLPPLARLNIVGPRESEANGVYRRSYDLLSLVLETACVASPIAAL